MAEGVKQPLDYVAVLRAIGHFVQRERLSEISILEYKDGWIIHGITFRQTAEGFIRVTSDHVLSHADIRKIQESLDGQRPQTKRRWL